MHHLDFFDICAILLGISFTIAKLDAQGRQASNFPQVPEAEFERWRNWTTSIYRLGSGVCFLRVVSHQAWALYLSYHPVTTPALPAALRYPPAAIDMLWLGIVVSTFFRASRARNLRRELGIVLAPLSPAQAAAMAPDNREDSEDQSTRD